MDQQPQRILSEGANYNHEGGNLNLIIPGRSAAPEHPRNSYLEYNDGKVCWYYPIFPEASTSETSSHNLLRYSNEYEDYFYDDVDLPAPAPAGDSWWSAPPQEQPRIEVGKSCLEVNN